jgi:hypothetical protein
MLIEVDGVELLTLTATQKNVIKNEVSSVIFEEDMKRRVDYILTHKYDQCFKRLKAEWDPKLEAAQIAIPADPDEYAQLVFAQPTYKDRATKDAEMEV